MAEKAEDQKKMDVPTLKIAAAAMSEHKTVATDISKRLGITTATLYKYVNGDGSLKELGSKLLSSTQS